MGLKQFLKAHQATTQVRHVEIDPIGKVAIRRPSISELEHIATLQGFEQTWETLRICVVEPKLSDEDRELFMNADVTVSEAVAKLMEEIHRFALGEDKKGNEQNG